jgi:hypothetical protein
MPGRPYLLENLTDDTTHAAALTYLAQDIATHIRLPSRLVT